MGRMRLRARFREADSRIEPELLSPKCSQLSGEPAGTLGTGHLVQHSSFGWDCPSKADYWARKEVRKSDDSVPVEEVISRICWPSVSP